MYCVSSGNVGSLVVKYIPKGQTLPVTASPHDYTVVPGTSPGTVTIKFNPLLETTSVTVIVDTPASPKIDYNLHLFITACFEHQGLIYFFYRLSINDNLVI